MAEELNAAEEIDRNHGHAHPGVIPRAKKVMPCNHMVVSAADKLDVSTLWPPARLRLINVIG